MSDGDAGMYKLYNAINYLLIEYYGFVNTAFMLLTCMIRKGFLRKENTFSESRKSHCYGNISLIKDGSIKLLHDKRHLLLSANV